ncbi:hypothetical protein D3C81_1233150 [compost metagenome]
MTERIVDIFKIICIHKQKRSFAARPLEVVLHRLQQGDTVRQITERIHIGQAVDVLLILEQHVVLLYKLLLCRRELFIGRFQLLIAGIQVELRLLTPAYINQGAVEQYNPVCRVNDSFASHFKPDIIIVLGTHAVFGFVNRGQPVQMFLSGFVRRLLVIRVNNTENPILERVNLFLCIAHNLIPAV